MIENPKSPLFKIYQKLELAFIRIAYRGWLHPKKMPTTVRVDASTLCQLRCEGCGFQKSNHRGLGGRGILN